MSDLEIVKEGGGKYRVPVYTKAYASKFVGHIEVDSYEEYLELLEEHAEELFESGYFSTNTSNDFDLEDVEIEDLCPEHLESYRKEVK